MEQAEPRLKLCRKNWGVLESRLESALAAVPDVELRTVAEFLGTLLPEFYSEPPKTDAEALAEIRRKKRLTGSNKPRLPTHFREPPRLGKLHRR